MPVRAPVRLPRHVDRLLAVAGVDWDPPTRQPAAGRVVLATVVALAGSLVAAALLVAVGTHVFPSTRGFTHFRPSDYGSLTVVGVLGACAGWPVVTRVSSAPRRLYFRLAVLVTLVLLLPDAWILVRGEPARAVGVLAAMHLAIALVTYNVVVSLAPAGRRRAARSRATPDVARARRAAAGRAVQGATGVGEPARRNTAHPSPRPDPAYGPDGTAIAVPVDTPTGPGTTALPDTGALVSTTALPDTGTASPGGTASGAAAPPFVASVVPLRPKAAPPVGGAAADAGRLHPGAAFGRTPVVRRLDDMRTRSTGAHPASPASPSGHGTAASVAADPERAARRTDRRSREGRATSVARPPATVAEPRSAVRLLPSPSGAGTDAMPAPVRRALDADGTARGGAAMGPAFGRHARRASDDTQAADGTGDRAESTARWRRGQRGRHAARS